MTLTPEDIAKLQYPFKRDDHDFLEGYVYISEEAITERIERVDPDWSFRIQQMISYGDSIVCIASLTIKGVERCNGGGNPVQRDKADKDKDGKKLGTYSMLPLYTQADNGVNAYKAAVTDALKRCARLFGIGRYLLSAPKEGGMFDKWLEQQHADAKAALLKLAKTDTATGEIKQQTDPKTASPSSTTNGSPNGDGFAKDFPAATKWTPAMLRDRTDTYFRDPVHFDHHWNKHAQEYEGKTLEEAIAFVHDLHWAYDKERIKALCNWAKAELVMTPDDVLAALKAASPKSIKGISQWEGGNYATAQLACRVWAEARGEKVSA